jgi:hypothetical protein
MPFHLSWVRTREDRRGTMKAYGTAVALSVSLRPCQDWRQRLGGCGDVGWIGKLGG